MMDDDQYLGHEQNMCKPNDKMKDTPLCFTLVDLKDLNLALLHFTLQSFLIVYILKERFRELDHFIPTTNAS